VTGDFRTSRIYRNNRNGTFTLANDFTVITDGNGMGGAIGDYDGDGDLDWFVSSIWDPNGVAEGNWDVTGNRLYRNRGDGTFEDATDAAGVRVGYWGWGSTFQDFDNDGNLDLFHVNGFGRADIPQTAEFVADPSVLFVSNGDGTFTERGAELGVADTDEGRGVVAFDYDGDGDLDLFVHNSEGPGRLYRNDEGNAGNWLDVVLHGRAPNTEGIGARVRVTPTAARSLARRQQLRVAGSRGRTLWLGTARAERCKSRWSGSTARARSRARAGEPSLRRSSSPSPAWNRADRQQRDSHHRLNRGREGRERGRQAPGRCVLTRPRARLLLPGVTAHRRASRPIPAVALPRAAARPRRRPPANAPIAHVRPPTAAAVNTAMTRCAPGRRPSSDPTSTPR
jgi:hypothetical protein